MFLNIENSCSPVGIYRSSGLFFFSRGQQSKSRLRMKVGDGGVRPWNLIWSARNMGLGTARPWNWGPPSSIHRSEVINPPKQRGRKLVQGFPWLLSRGHTEQDQTLRKVLQELCKGHFRVHAAQAVQQKIVCATTCSPSGAVVRGATLGTLAKSPNRFGVDSPRSYVKKRAHATD